MSKWRIVERQEGPNTYWHIQHKIAWFWEDTNFNYTTKDAAIVMYHKLTSPSTPDKVVYP